MIQKSDISIGINMCLKKFTVVCCIYHIGWSNDYIWFTHTFDEFNVFCESGNIGIIYIILRTVLREHQLELAALGVDVVMAPGTQMLYQ